MSQAGQAQNFHEEGVRALEEARGSLSDALGRMSTADKELRKGNLTPEAAAVWQEKFDTAYADSERLKKLAAGLTTSTSLAATQLGARRPTPAYRRPMGEGAAAGQTWSDQNLGADGEPLEELGDDAATFEEAERRVLSSRDVAGPADPRATRFFTQRARVMLNKAFRSRGFHSLSRKEAEFLTASRVDQLMSPYIDRDGGMITAEEMRNEVISHIRDLTYIRGRAYKIATQAASVAFPSMKLDVRLTGTRAGRGTGEAPVRLRDIFGKTRFIPSGEGRIVLVPEELLQDATYDIVGFIAREIAKNDLEMEEELFLAGSGSGEPLGILTALQKLKAAGYPEIGFAHSGSSNGDFTAEDIRIFRYNLKAKYRVGGPNDGPSWLGPRAFIRRVALFRTEPGGAHTGDFLFQSGLSAGDPNTLAGDIFLESEFITDAITTGTAGDPMVLYGNLGYYWIVDRSSLDVKVLGELYQETDEIGYKYSKRFDAAPVRPDAFIYMERK
jgi:HK97 family phage major capsid protein